MRKLIATAVLVLVGASFGQFGLGGGTVDTSAYDATILKTEQIKAEMEKLTYQVDQARDFLVVLFGDHGMPDPFEEDDTSDVEGGTLKGALSAAEEAEANEHLGDFTDLPETIENLLKRVGELLPTVVENIKQIGQDIADNPAQATTLQETQEKLNEAQTNLQEALDMLPPVKADVETISAILQAIL
ncbi:hypothetical protein KAU45_05405 [bacterium]|nr:hypothetical protein [bacterium]